MPKTLKSLQTDLEDLFLEGKEKVHIVADFDGTLTREYVGGKKVYSIISVLRDQPGYLDPTYQTAAHELFNKYQHYEKDLAVSFAERKSMLHEWWTSHYRLLIKSGLRKDQVEQVATSGIVQFRDGAKDFLQLSHELNIPVIIFSASGLGEAIPMYCSHEKVDFPNVHFIVNRFIWDENGYAVGYSEPVIHGLNKNETVISGAIEQEIKNRVNVLLLGNNDGDLGMIEGRKFQKEVTVGFLDPEEEARKSELEKSFQHVIVGGYEKINEMLTEIS